MADDDLAEFFEIPGPRQAVTENPKPRDKTFFIMVHSIVFGSLFILVPLLIRKGPNAGIARCCFMLTIFCIWIFWITIYISQMQPLVGPVLENTTIAWIMHSWPYKK